MTSSSDAVATRTSRTTLRSASSIIAIATLLHLPVSCDLIGRADLLSPERPGAASLPDEVLTIACAPILLGAMLTYWSLRARHARSALLVALAIAVIIAVWHAYHFNVVVPEIRAAKR